MTSLTNRVHALALVADLLGHELRGFHSRGFRHEGVKGGLHRVSWMSSKALWDVDLVTGQVSEVR